LLAAAPLPGQVRQVRVTADRAPIRLEPRSDSTMIATINRGAVLDLFQPNKIAGDWYYVAFRSARLGSRVSGFIEASRVEPVDRAAKPRTREKGDIEPVPSPNKAPNARAAPPGPPSSAEDVERDIDVQDRKWAVEEPYLRLHTGRIELGCTTQSNMFQEFGTARPAVAATVSGDLVGRINLARRLTLFPRLAFAINRNFEYPSAGYPELLAGASLKYRGHAVSLEWTGRSSRLLYISSRLGEVVYDSRSLELTYKGRLLSRLVVRLEYGRLSEDYLEPANGRTMTGRAMGVRLGYDVAAAVGLEAGFDLTRETATDMDYSLEKSEPWGGVRLVLRSGLELYARYKISVKEYTTNRMGDRNFSRRDTYHNLLVELRVPVRRSVVLVVKNFHRRGLSTRPNRDFANNELTGTLSFIF
jgi:hypothetical protein